MSIQAADCRPSFDLHRRIAAADLLRLDEPCVVFEACWLDDDGELCWAYTVGGLLDGHPVGDARGGATVGGEVIIVHAASRGVADGIAVLGLEDTIDSLRGEDAALVEAAAAGARLDSVGAVRRLELATAREKNDEFVRDARAIERLRGDDVVLTVGGVSAG